MRFVVIAVMLAACLPDEAENYPIVPWRGPPAWSGVNQGPDAASIDAGLADGSGPFDAGPDAQVFFDARPPDATVLLPDSQEQVPPFP